MSSAARKSVKVKEKENVKPQAQEVEENGEEEFGPQLVGKLEVNSSHCITS